MATASFETAIKHASQITKKSQRWRLEQFILDDLRKMQEAARNGADPEIHHPEDDDEIDIT